VITYKVPIPTLNPPRPLHDFPHTKGDLFNLADAQVNLILIYYGLPTEGDIMHKTMRLAQHLGLPKKLL
jgi:hypothetical protein